jgi:hypothetical protein
MATPPVYSTLDLLTGIHRDLQELKAQFDGARANGETVDVVAYVDKLDRWSTIAIRRLWPREDVSGVSIHGDHRDVDPEYERIVRKKEEIHAFVLKAKIEAGA